MPPSKRAFEADHGDTATKKHQSSLPIEIDGRGNLIAAVGRGEQYVTARVHSIVLQAASPVFDQMIRDMVSNGSRPSIILLNHTTGRKRIQFRPQKAKSDLETM